MDTSIASQPGHVATDVPIKRPPEDEEPFDALMTVPSKRQALESPTSHAPEPAPRPAPGVTRDPLEGKTPEELISVIHQMQDVHNQQMAELRHQYGLVSRQLDQLRSLTNNHFTSQILAIQSVQRTISSIPSPQPLPQIVSSKTTTPIPDPPSVSHTAPPRPFEAATAAPTVPKPSSDNVLATPQRELHRSPSISTPASAAIASSFPGPTSSASAKTELKITPSASPHVPPTVEQSSLDTVPEIWEEYRYGRSGNPPLETLDALWGPRWRPDAKIRVWYGRRKAILDRIRELIADGIDEENAVMEVEKMRRGRTLQWLARILLEDRKATRKQWKAAQAAATAAKNAMDGLPPVE